MKQIAFNFYSNLFHKNINFDEDATFAFLNSAELPRISGNIADLIDAKYIGRASGGGCSGHIVMIYRNVYIYIWKVRRREEGMYIRYMGIDIYICRLMVVFLHIISGCVEGVYPPKRGQ